MNLPRAGVTVLILGATLASVACTNSNEPDSAIVARIEVDAGEASPGAPIMVRFIAENRGKQTISLRAGCWPGPSFDFEVLLPSGEIQYPFTKVLWACAAAGAAVLGPFEADTVKFPWQAPATEGKYSLRTGVMTLSGTLVRSAGFELTVK